MLHGGSVNGYYSIPVLIETSAKLVSHNRDLSLLNPGASIVDHRSRCMLLESDAAFVWRFELIGFTDSFAVDDYRSVWSVIEDLEQKPFLIMTDDSLRRSDTIDTTGGIRAVRSIEALYLDAAFSIIEEHATISIDDSLNPGLEFVWSFKFFLSDCRAVIALAGESIVLDLPIGVSLRAESVHARYKQINPFLLAG